MDLTRAKTEGKKWGKRVLIAVVLLGIIGPVLYTEGALHFSYSSGERTGFVQKLSKKGWICKTNEGELAMVNMAGQQATIFLFTAPDDKVCRGDRVVRRPPRRAALRGAPRHPLELLRGHAVFRHVGEEDGLKVTRPSLPELARPRLRPCTACRP